MKNKYTLSRQLTTIVAVLSGVYLFAGIFTIIAFMMTEPQPPPSWVNLIYVEWFLQSAFYVAAPICVAFIAIGGYCELKEIDEHYRLSNEPFRQG